jgi:hypothetical protein
MKSVTEGDLADGATGHQLSGFLEVATGPSPVFYTCRPYQTRWDCMASPAVVKVPSRVDGRPGGCRTVQTFAEPVGSVRCLSESIHWSKLETVKIPSVKIPS